jgi:putative LysE/RhtB family amino acid efflux pump
MASRIRRKIEVGAQRDRQSGAAHSIRGVTPALQLLFGGFGAGVAMAAPVGPVAALCISVTLRRGPAHGMVAGLGAALADALFAAIAVFGFAGISSLLDGHDATVRIAAGLLVGLLACRFLRRPGPRLEPQSEPVGDHGRHIRRSFLGPLLLTLGNPATIVSFAAVLSALGLHDGEIGIGGSLLVTAGVFAGALAWWSIVTTVAGHIRGRSRPGALARFERIVTVVLLGFSAVLVTSGIVPLLAAI